ncbi:MAG TPA: lytic transglycosylase domain-containing protein [Mesotoga sp.]|nr:lytic transglycosylase domain-containing protein [Mesotoga sp.]
MRKLVYLALILTTLLYAVKVSPLQIMEWSEEVETKNEIEPELLAAIAFCESSFRSSVVSESGAVGLFQFKEIAVKDVANRLWKAFDPYDPEQSTHAAKYYLSWLMDHFDSLELVIMAWNFGYGNTKKYLNGGEIEEDVLVFVERVMSLFEEYKALYTSKPAE